MHGKELVPLKRWSEQDLVNAARQGSHIAIKYLVVDYGPIQRVVKSLARSLDPCDLAGDELTAAARLGILEALRRFDPNRSVRISTYAYNFIRAEMIKARYSQGQRREWNAGRPRPKLIPLSTESDDEAVGQTFEAELFARDSGFGLDHGYLKVDKEPSMEAVRSFVAALPPGQHAVIRDVFWSGQSHTETARRRGVSRPAVSRTLRRAFERGRRDLADHRECLAA
jgi:RNA polymerase sigma factor (sigma-70 family)